MRNQVSSNLKKRNDFRCSGKLRGHGGFTLAELLIVIAIILILAGFGFVNVIENQRRLHLREMDDTARQIFIAAQNHLTVAEASGQWDYEKLSKISTEEDDDDDDGNISTEEDDDDGNFFGGTNSGAHSIYTWLKDESDRYYYVTKGDLSKDNAIKYILPFGAIDETVRNGAGQYIILYDAKAATINGVFYTDSSEDELNIGAANSLYDNFIKGGDNNRRGRQTQISRKTVVGWYGPGKAEDVDENGLLRPIVAIENEEALVLNVVDRNDKPTGSNAATKVKVTFKGLTSGATLPEPVKVFSQGIHTADRLQVQRKGSNGNFMNDEAPALDAFWCANSGPYQGVPNSAWNYRFYLDSVTTKNGHFADIFGSAGFIPGEDIEISVTIIKEENGTSKESKASVVTTNSLFGSVSSGTATVLNGRHLQNLSYDISHVSYKTSNTTDDTPNLNITGADIRQNIEWKAGTSGTTTDFISRVESSGYYTPTSGKVSVYDYNATVSKETAQGYEQFSSVRNTTLSKVTGNSNTLSNFDIVQNGIDMHAGLFSAFNVDGTEIQDLKLNHFTVNANDSSGDAGALVGNAEKVKKIDNIQLLHSIVTSASGSAGALCGSSKNTEITKVLAYHEAQTGTDYDASKESLITGKVSGGLVGTMDGGKIKQSAAAVYVKATGTGATDNAGGLVGTCTGSVDVTDSYAGGHTAGSATSDIDLIGYYQGVTTGTERGRYNIISAGGAAGGLIGSYAGGNITNCYSTCSANGKSAAGGFIGNATGGTIKNTYCTGLVGSDGTKGAFIGSSTSTISISTDANKQSYYFQIINNGMLALGSSANDVTTVKAIDENLDSYNRFTDFTNSKNANAYDAGLARIYGENHYILKTINSTGNDTSHALSGKAADGDPDWLTTHYGDWPAPETLVVNVPAGS